VMHHTDADPQLLRTAISAGILRAGRARISTLSALLATPDPDERPAVLRHALARWGSSDELGMLHQLGLAEV